MRPDVVVVVWGVALYIAEELIAFVSSEWLLNILIIDDKHNRVISELIRILNFTRLVPSI